ITPGRIDVFAPRPVDGTGVRVASFTVPQCLNGPVGLALGPAQHLIGACDTGAALVGLHNGSFEKLIPNVGGADEIWFNPGDRNVYLARLLPTLQGQLGVGDAVSGRFLQNLPTGLLAHSVAAYAGNNHIFVPVSGGGIQVFQSSGDPGS
ncbi:MAG: hypothetical protein J2P45_15535, partial [Candidatus Dormibacteraeota bacterium]|nr:hypothetical protein [Candidatus Dormibacteraeota bacterium]